MKLLTTSALALCMLVLLGCAEGNAPDPEAANVISAANKKVEANIEGMDCSGCSYGIETALKEIEGVTAAKADHATGDVTVALADDADVEAAKAEVEKVIQGLSDGKYTVKTITATSNADPVAKPSEEPPAEEPANEEPAAEEQAGTAPATFFVASYKVTGMDCSGCSSSIVKAVEQVDGVQKVEADLAAGTVVVSFEDRFDDKIKTDEIKDVIGGLSNGKYTASY